MATLLEKADWVLGVTPHDGSAITNKEARRRIVERYAVTLSQEEYVEARDFMVGLGRVMTRRGGVICRTERLAEPPPGAAGKPPDWSNEANLYMPIAGFLQLTFWRDPRVDLSGELFVAQTAANWQSAPRRWSVPDIVLIARTSYRFFDRYDLDVWTFEAKTERGLGDRPVYQAYAQSAAAHGGYLVWHCSDASFRASNERELRLDCQDTGVGLIVCSDPLNHGSYDIVCPAQRRRTNAAAVDQFLEDRLAEKDARDLHSWLGQAGG